MIIQLRVAVAWNERICQHIIIVIIAICHLEHHYHRHCSEKQTLQFYGQNNWQHLTFILTISQTFNSQMPESIFLPTCSKMQHDSVQLCSLCTERIIIIVLLRKVENQHIAVIAFNYCNQRNFTAKERDSNARNEQRSQLMTDMTHGGQPMCKAGQTRCAIASRSCRLTKCLY